MPMWSLKENEKCSLWSFIASKSTQPHTKSSNDNIHDSRLLNEYDCSWVDPTITYGVGGAHNRANYKTP
jgi:hypothetical protein